MKKILIVVLFFVASCGQKQTPIQSSTDTWDMIMSTASNSTVSMHMWGGDEILNRYLSEYVVPDLKEMYGITLSLVPISDPKDTVNKLIVEKQADRNTGSADIIWINGENFKLSKEAQVLWSGFTAKLPNLEFVDPLSITTDFGTPIEGDEAPWGISQFNFIYRGDSAIPFTDAPSLSQYVKNNPSRFTYPAIPDFTGSAFVRNIALDILGYENVVAMSNEELEQNLTQVWTYFNDLKSYLWRNGETYPESVGKLDLLFKNNDVDIMMSYAISTVSFGILNGEYPATSKNFLLDKGTLFNNHYLSIPWNAPNKNGALVVINYFLSKKEQLRRLEPKNIGWPTILTLESYTPDEQITIKKLGQSEGVVTLEEQQAKRISELSPEKLEIIEKGWLKNVAGISF